MAVSEEDRVRAYVARRDVPCPSCGYNLRGLTAGICPECGYRPRLRAILEPRAMPVPVHLRVAMGLEILLAVGAAIEDLRSGEGFLVVFFMCMIVGTALWYGVWRVGSAVSGETEPWKLSVLGAALWCAVAMSCVVVLCCL